MQKQNCVKLIKSFIAEKLDGDIQKFFDYDLDQLEMDTTYGAYDPDDSKIANAIYVVLWSDTVPDMIINNYWYRGDTINSFHTVMGRPNEHGTNFLGIQKYTNDVNIINLAKKYHKKYHTIGNFIILPNKKLGSTTLNKYRSSKWSDYFDLFLSNIKDLMIGTNTNQTDERLKELVETNNNFFDYFCGTQGFIKFCKTFYLDPYVDYEHLEVRKVFSPHACHRDNEYSEQEYNQYVTSYITKATEIIDFRCGRMIEDLKRKLLYT